MKNTFKFLSIVSSLILLSSCMQPAKKLGLTYGAFIRPNGVEFKLYAPSSEKVSLVIFSQPEDEFGTEIPMSKNESGDWTLFHTDAGIGTLYGYKLTGPYNDENVIIADPYSKAAVTQNSWRHVAKTLIIDSQYNWEGDTWKNIHPRDLIVYEAHVRDMTIHKSSNAKEKGSYLGFIEKDQNGGIAHLKSIGVNAVQFLPLWDFANVEIPYKQDADGLYNNWNPYARNHWGYMPTFYMAPESYYATNGTDEPNAWNGIDGRAVTEMKDMVKSLHREGMAVILDVVVNHISNYDWHPLKYIDKTVYFKLDENENFISQCCGNLLASDNKPVQNYIVESLKFWLTEFHIDGFRFDQAHLLSPETATLILDELKMINPNVIIYGEAWNEREKEFSELGWGSFNARFRDVLRGDLHNFNEQGFLFGKFRKGESLEDLQSLIMGTISGKKSVYQTPAHAINFLEVHDDFCFNDYLRLSTGENSKSDIIDDPMKHIELSPELLKINKLGALILMTSQGIPMIHQGQDWAHSQIIADTEADDPDIGKMDRNPYNKDNETNWVNWLGKEQNSDLANYYSGLIKLRRGITELRHANPKDFKFQGLSELALGYIIRNRIGVYINGNPNDSVSTELPDGTWSIIANGEKVDTNGIGTISGEISIPPTSGVVLKRIN